MKSVPSVRIPAKIARDLGVKIVSGRIGSEQILDGEVEASGRRRVSRSAYREAMRILIAKGLVESRPKVGTWVSKPERWHLLDPDVLEWMFAREPEPHLVASLFEMRKMLEPDVARLAAMRRTPEQLAQLIKAMGIMERKTLQTAQGRLADQRFHALLIAAADNAFLTAFTSSIMAAVNWSTAYKNREHRLRGDAVQDHRWVLDAVAAGDAAGAHAAMTRLLDLAFSDLARGRKKERASLR
jgi:DNA-binding FadR family transcriptional regulator